MALKMNDKIIKNEQEFKKLLSKKGEIGSIVVCKGHFNIIHPGHIRFLKHAKEHGDTLIVLLLNDIDLAENKNRNNFFCINDRAEGLASLHFVDFIVYLDEMRFEILANNLPPLTFIMGKEFEIEKRSEIEEEIKLIKKHNGKIVFHSGHLYYSSNDLIENNVDSIDHQKWQEFKKVLEVSNINIRFLLKSLENLKDLKILVIGDTIVDQFIACDAIGMSAEAPVIVLKELNSKEFIGGGAIVSAHAKSLGSRSIYLSVIGDDASGEKVELELKSNKIDTILFKDSERPTTFKIRYIVENQKIFRVSRLEESYIPAEIEEKVIEKIKSLMCTIDAIIISDFVYGLITPKILEIVIDLAVKNKVKLFGDLQCSSQIGNICKFRNFHLITPTEREARIALGDNDSGLEKLAMKVIEETNVKNLIITLGINGCVAYKRSGNEKIISQHFPALCSNPVDAAGAGDALLTTVSLVFSSGLEFFHSVAIGVCAAAISVKRVGNIPIKCEEIRNYIIEKEKINNY
jgi:rfaE bifunctional protein kinase chain/domain